MRPTLPLWLSFNGGYVDTAGFLVLQGLFTAHVTGNFVTFGAAMANGTSGAVAKLLALPVFCVVVMATRIICQRLATAGLPALHAMLLAKVALLAVGAACAIAWGPFSDGDSGRAIATGMALVAAMAIQNAVHRIHFGKAPPSTLMTGTSTQIMMDVADLLTRRLPPQAHGEATARLAKMGTTLLAFALGCALAALIYVAAGMWVFLLPPLVALVPVVAPRLAVIPEGA